MNYCQGPCLGHSHSPLRHCCRVRRSGRISGTIGINWNRFPVPRIYNHILDNWNSWYSYPNCWRVWFRYRLRCLIPRDNKRYWYNNLIHLNCKLVLLYCTFIQKRHTVHRSSKYFLTIKNLDTITLVCQVFS